MYFSGKCFWNSADDECLKLLNKNQTAQHVSESKKKKKRVRMKEANTIGFPTEEETDVKKLYGAQVPAWHERGFKLPDIYWKQSGRGEKKQEPD